MRKGKETDEELGSGKERYAIKKQDKEELDGRGIERIGTKEENDEEEKL